MRLVRGIQVLVATYILLLIAAAAIFIFGCSKQRGSPHVKVARVVDRKKVLFHSTKNFRADNVE